jgi:hypothetical protein
MEQVIANRDLPCLQPADTWRSGEAIFSCYSGSDDSEEVKKSNKQLFDKILRECMTI